MLALLKLPIIRHLIAGILILAIGFITGNTVFQKRLSEAKKQTQLISGKYTELEKQYTNLSIRTDTLQKAIISLAKKEHIKVDNHISNPKIKRGSSLNFVPEKKTKVLFKEFDKKSSWMKRLFKKGS
ncbi:hypothetical protein NBT05_12355 [Aquimarina sp. ERC-38]|uniref:hypothetical protein n=1 Tax=Aquimarina sp. ERC-38 TaxID=2949996 RepID=UPI00224500CC|nr:hypothetical protein [Aquimarina sp. ERC-38]UZO79740.1 hypothetical protein NBT05_12355 [Aquimarina sp. ERC-38]